MGHFTEIISCWLHQKKVCWAANMYIIMEKDREKLVKKFGYFIPLLKMLEMLIKLPQIQRFIQKDHMSLSSSEIKKDECDGHYIKSHELKDEK